MAAAQARSSISSPDNLRRLPPQDIEAEQAVLGAIVVDNTALVRVLDILSPDDFYREAHRVLFTLMLELHERREPIDSVTLKSAGLEALKALTDCAAYVPGPQHAAHYARIVREKAMLRRLIRVATQVASTAYDAPTGNDLAKLMIEAEADIAAVNRTTPAETLSPLDDVAAQIVEEARTNPKRNTVATGFQSLDRSLKGSGLGRGSLVTVAGATSVGKSAFALNLLTHTSRGGALYCSVEMSREDLIERALSDFASVDFGDVAQRHESASDPAMRISGFMETELERLAKARERLFLMNLEIVYQPVMTVADIAAQMRACAHRWDGKLDLVVVDYLQILTPVEREDKRHVELSVMTKALKRLAGEFQTPVVLLSQLTREAGKRGGCPLLQELREAGSIENDSDVVMFLWEETKAKSAVASALSRGKAINLSLAKQRNGPLHTVSLCYEGAYFRFTEV